MAVDHKRQSSEELAGLTALRIPLIWWVAVYHFSMPGSWLDPETCWWPVARLLRSCLSVDILFVLSGYLLARVHRDMNLSGAGRFLWTRAARILPLHILGLLLCLPFVFAAGTYAPATLPLILLCCGLCLHAWIPTWALAINPPSWYLSADAFLCACFPILQPVIRRLQKSSTCLWWLVGTWLLATIPCWLLSRTDPGIAQLSIDQNHLADGTLARIIKFLPLIHLPEFVAGMLLCAWHHHHAWRGDGRLRTLLGGTIILGGIVLGAGILPFAPTLNGLFLPATCLLILGLADRRWSDGFLAHPIISLLGRASFAFFVLHTPLAMIAHSLQKRCDLLANIPSSVFGLLVLVATQIAAIATMHWVEDPLRRRLRPTQPTKVRV